MNLRYHVEYALFKVFHLLLRRLPFPALKAVFRAIAAGFHAIGVRRSVVVTNLCVVLGRAAPDREVRALARKCYAEHGRMIAEILKEELLTGNPEKHFRISGLEHLKAGVEKKKGVIILTAHLGNTVLGGYRMAQLGYTYACVSKPVFNPAIREELEKIYTRYGNTLIIIRSMQNDSQGGLKIFRHLKSGGTVVVINDQDAGPEGYKSTFFGLKTSIPSGPARFAIRTGAVVLTVFAARRNGKIDIDIQGPIDSSAAGSASEAERVVLDEYSRRLEQKIREAPELYFWFHRKWKSTPEVRAIYDKGRR